MCVRDASGPYSYALCARSPGSRSIAIIRTGGAAQLHAEERGCDVTELRQNCARIAPELRAPARRRRRLDEALEAHHRRRRLREAAEVRARRRDVAAHRRARRLEVRPARRLVAAKRQVVEALEARAARRRQLGRRVVGVLPRRARRARVDDMPAGRRRARLDLRVAARAEHRAHQRVADARQPPVHERERRRRPRRERGARVGAPLGRLAQLGAASDLLRVGRRLRLLRRAGLAARAAVALRMVELRAERPLRPRPRAAVGAPLAVRRAGRAAAVVKGRVVDAVVHRSAACRGANRRLAALTCEIPRATPDNLRTHGGRARAVPVVRRCRSFALDA